MSADPARNLTLYERVCCLECGTVYPKRTHGGTTAQNPGCPSCGYVGWIPTRRHAVADQGNVRRKAQ